MQLRLLAGVAEVLVEQVLGQVEGDRAGPHLVQVLHVQRDALADDALQQHRAGTDQQRGQLQQRVGGKCRAQLFVRQLDAVAGHAGEGDLQRLARPHGVHAHRLGRLGRLDHHGLGGEVEGDAEDVGIFGVEHFFVIQLVGLAAQGAADDLLTEQLRPEGAHAQHMGDRVGVPALGEHRDRDNAAHTLTVQHGGKRQWITLETGTLSRFKPAPHHARKRQWITQQTGTSGRGESVSLSAQRDGDYLTI